MQFAIDDDPVTGIFDEKYEVTSCKLAPEEQNDTVIGLAPPTELNNAPLKHIESVEHVVAFDVNQYGLFYLTNDGAIPGIHQFDYESPRRGGSIKLYEHLLYVESAFGQIILYDLKQQQYRVENDVEVKGKTFGHLGPQLWSEHDWGVGCQSPDSNYQRDGYWKYDYFALNLQEKSLTPMEHTVGFSFDAGCVLLNYNQRSSSLDALDKQGRIIWSYPIEGRFTPPGRRTLERSLKSMFGVVGNLVWFLINSGEIVGLEKETGEVKHIIKVVKHYGMFYDRMSNQLINQSVSIDLSQSEPKANYFENHPVPDRKHFIPSTAKLSSYVIGNKLLVMDNSSATIALLNLETNHFEWCYDIFETTDRFGLKSAKQFENKLCVLDGGETLHVYELNNYEHPMKSTLPE